MVQNINLKICHLYQTRKQEITEQEYDSLSDDEKRFYQRKLTKQGTFYIEVLINDEGVWLKQRCKLKHFKLLTMEL